MTVRAEIRPEPPREEIPRAKLFSGHHPDCRLILAEDCAAPIECRHGFDVCPECDKCECE